MRKEQIRWACRRGMLELDILLEAFFDKHFDTLTSEQQQIFEALLVQQDPDLYSWFIGLAQPTDEKLKDMVHLIKATKLNEHFT